MELLTTLILSIFIVGSLWAVSNKNAPEWNKERFADVPGGKNKWTLVFALASVLGVGASVALHLIGISALPAASISILVWLFVLVCYTDLTVLRIPKEPSILAYYLGIPLLVGYSIQTMSWSPLIAFGIWMIIPLIFFIPKGIGMGDVRLMLVAATSISWWVGIEGMFVKGLLIGALMQAVFFAVAHITKKFGIRAYKGELAAKAAGKEFKVPSNTSAKKRLHLPFGPALVLGFIIATFWVSIVSHDSGICYAITGNFC